jgi:hypothetical protein
LAVGPGDELVYDIARPGEVILRRGGGVLLDDPFRLFEEWASEIDEAAYANLSADPR